jgi:hypothetical protein
MSSQRFRNQIWVYLTPDKTNGRYRSGVAYTLQISKTLNDQYVSNPWQYIQILLPNENFDNVLQIPKVGKLPFQYPSQSKDGSQSNENLLSQKEIINILDFVRDPNTYLTIEDLKVISREELPNGATISKIWALFPQREKMAEIVISQPVISIRDNTGEITITFGFIHNGLYARCYNVKLRRNEKKYEIIEWTSWIS